MKILKILAILGAYEKVQIEEEKLKNEEENDEEESENEVNETKKIKEKSKKVHRPKSVFSNGSTIAPEEIKQRLLKV